MVEKTLYILRHAKTEPLGGGQEDKERPLAERGVTEAKNLGKYMLSQHIKPERVWCSSATRTRQTLQHLQSTYGETLKVHYDDTLYHMSMQDMIRMLTTVPEPMQSLLWVGHNPGLHEFCMKMAATSESDAARRIYNKFPPCSFVEFTFSGNWKDITKSDVALKRFISPADLAA